MSLMKSDRTKAPKSDRIAGYAITLISIIRIGDPSRPKPLKLNSVKNCKAGPER